MSARRIRFGLILAAAVGVFQASCGPSTALPPTSSPVVKSATPARRDVSPAPTNPPAAESAGSPVALGANHTCVLTIGNGVACWGNNRYGQLGNGTILGATLPQAVSRMTAGVRSIVAGGSHTCALLADGVLECWGGNAKGQLGHGVSPDSFAPVPVFGLSEGVKAAAAGARHTCVLMETGGVKCWGENASGGVGDGTAVNRDTPVDVPGLATGVAAVEAGAGHTCAVMLDGSVKCWGWNLSGQLGNGTTTDSRLPAEVGGLPGPVRALALGDQHTCALLEDGSVMCWGANASGQLGNGARVRSNTPVAVGGLDAAARQITAGAAHTCALLEHDTVMCWGDDQSGQLGDGGYENRSAPAAVAGLAGDVEYLAAGSSHTCVVLRDRRIQCWGFNGEGQLGDGTVKSRRIPGETAGYYGGTAAISAGWSNTCALGFAGRLQCWGLNDGGQLGDGGFDDSPAPVEVRGLASGRIAVAVGGGHSCALSATGGVKCWGRNNRGQLGGGASADRNAPIDVAGLPEQIVAIAAGKEHTCALTARGGVKCWGANDAGQLGDGTTADSGKPVDVLGLEKGISAISAGGGHTCALGRNGALKCWGSNAYGQLGDGTLENRSAPVDVAGLTAGVHSVAAGGAHTCAIVSGTMLKCWGWNAYGQLGDSTPTDRNTPVDVRWLAGTAAYVSAGADYTCAVMRAGNLRCWGNNEFGQLGDGTVTARPTPVGVLGLQSKVLLLATGYYTTCAVTAEGKMKCWGNNLYGQLGNGATANSAVPVDVAGLDW